MFRLLPITVLLLLVSLVSGQSYFVENAGQWNYPFDYKWQTANSAVFVGSDNLVVKLINQEAVKQTHLRWHGHDIPDNILEETAYAYEMRFQGTSHRVTKKAAGIRPERFNYFLGNDSKQWRSNVRAFEELEYQGLYDKVDIRYYFSAEGNLKYDFIIHPHGKPSKIQWEYIGAQDIELVEGNLQIRTSLQTVVELAPFAYQIIDGQRRIIKCSYLKEGDLLSFSLGEYHPKHTLIIDPEVIFSTFSGSSANNFGFSATYSEEGKLYAAGVVFENYGKYPVTRGVVQANRGGGRVDIGISKFSEDGTQLEYATYLGGREDEIPYSLIETPEGNLAILGITGSDNFPITINAYSPQFQGGGSQLRFFRDEISFPNGTDMFVMVLSGDGSSNLGSTYFGGIDNDGINPWDFNYGDFFRGEIIADSLNNIYIAFSSNSADLPVDTAAYQSAFGGRSDGVVASFSSGLENLRWATYIGGVERENAVSLKLSPDQQSVYVCGTSWSDDLGFSPDSYQHLRFSNTDGYVMGLNSASGAFLYGTFNGSYDRDANFFVEVDKNGFVYILGQTRGQYPIIGDSLMYINAGSSHYLQQFAADLKTSAKSTVFGDGQHKVNNISPTAFLVDECNNIYVSGWGGIVNQGANHGQGLTQNLPLTANAYQKTTDNSDFYFFVLDGTWTNLEYASYFGGGNGDHVDGGTSRFSPDGIIYQAVCGGCFGNSDFPTTDNAYSRINAGGSNGCNLAVMKINFEALEVEAIPVPDNDTSCVPFIVNFDNKSKNADVFEWVLPDGSRTQYLDSLRIDKPGKYEVRLIAIDTLCGKIDSTDLSIYGYDSNIHAEFYAEHDNCSSDLLVNFHNNSSQAVSYVWNFGDGTTSTDANPTHKYKEAGNYRPFLTAYNNPCGCLDTASVDLNLLSLNSSSDFLVEYEPCERGNLVSFNAEGTYFQEYLWSFGQGDELSGRQVEYEFEQAGIYRISLSLTDTICDRYLKRDTIINIYDENFEPSMANVFSPNGDGVNDYFGIPPYAHPEFYDKSSLQIFNRWGVLLYQTNEVSEPWDGTFEGQKLAEGVYFYILNLEDACKNTKEIKGFVHLMH